MSATLKGRAVFWSVGAITFTAGIVSSTDPHMTQSSRLARSSERATLKDDGGVIRSMIYHGKTRTVSLTVVPYAATPSLANAKTSADPFLIEPGTTITVVDDSGAIMDGSYNLASATESRTVDGVRAIDLELEKGDEGVDTTTLVS
jgi:hypothetical protein